MQYSKMAKENIDKVAEIGLKAIGKFFGVSARLFQSFEEPDTAIDMFMLKRNCAIEGGDKQEEAKAYRSLGNIYMKQNDSAKAKETFLQYMGVEQYDKNINEKITAYLQCGEAHIHTDDFDGAMQYLQQGLFLAEQLEDKDSMAVACHNIGVAFRQLKNDEDAINFYKQSLEHNKTAGNEDIEKKASVEVANSLLSRGLYQETIAFYDRSLRAAIRMKDHEVEASTYAGLGDANRVLGHSNLALKNYEAFLDLAREDKDGDPSTADALTTRWRVYYGLGRIHSASGEYEKACGTSAKLLEISEALRETKKEITTLLDWGRDLEALGSSVDSRKRFETALEKAQGIDDDELIEDAYFALGGVCHALECYGEAVIAYDEWLDFNSKREHLVEGHQNGQTNKPAIYYNKGSAHQLLEDYEQAIEAYEKCRQISQDEENKDMELRSYLGLVNCYLATYKFKAVEEVMEKVLELIRVNGYDSALTLEAFLCMAQANFTLCRFDKAFEQFSKCLNLAIESRDKVEQMNVYCCLGEVRQQTGKDKDATEQFQNALRLAEEAKRREPEGKIHAFLAESWLHLGNQNKAKDHAERCLLIGREINSKPVIARGYRAMGVVSQMTGKHEEAIENLNKAFSEDPTDMPFQGIVYCDLGRSYLLLDPQAAFLYFEESHLIAEQIGDKFLGARCNNLLGEHKQIIGEMETAMRYHESALCVSLEIGDKTGEALASANIGKIHLTMGRWREAKEFQEKAQHLAIETENKEILAFATENLGEVYLAMGKCSDAKEKHEKCLNIASSICHKELESKANANIGKCLQSEGSSREALKYFDRALRLAGETRDVRSKGKALGGKGRAYHALGEYVEALQHHESRLQIAKNAMDKNEEEVTYEDLGNVWAALGYYERAKHSYEKQIELAFELGNTRRQASACGNLGEICMFLGDSMGAIGYHLRHLDLAHELGDKSSEAKAAGNLGHVYYEKGEYDIAARYQREKARLSVQTEDPKSEGSANLELGKVYMSMKEYKVALVYIETSNQIAARIGDKLGEAQSNTTLGQYYNCLANASVDRANCKSELLLRSEGAFSKALECYEELFKNLKNEDRFKVSFTDTFIETYKLLMAGLIENGKTDQGLLVCEKGRAKALYDAMILKYNHALDRPWVGRQMKDFEDDSRVLSCFRSKACVLFYAFAANKQKLFLWASSRDRTQSPKVFTITKDAPVAPDSLEKTIAAVCNTIGERGKRVKAFSRIPDAAHDSLSFLLVNEEGGQQARSEPEISAMESLLDTQRHLKDLFDTLIGPVQHLPAFKDNDELVIVADESLHTLPWAALVTDLHKESYLSDHKRVRLVPSLTTLKILQECPLGFYNNTGALVVGDSLGDLDGARREAENVGALLGVRPFIKSEATKANVLRQIQQGVRVIHFATHGLATGEIVLAKDATDALGSDVQYVLLKKDDVQELDVRAQLVILSCCNSGAGEIRAEGLVGQVRAFLAAGVRAVVATHWRIHDEGTLEFMKRFYRHLLSGRSANGSLHQAANEMKKTQDFCQPKYWAGFSYYGEDVIIS